MPDFAPPITGRVHALLRAEGLAVLALATTLFALGHHSWLLFALLFFVPDVSLAGYLAGPRFGAGVYNAFHSYVGPALLAVVLVAAGQPAAVPLIWSAHIGFDRALGYGLKYASGFPDTHLGRIGRGSGDVPGR